MRILIVCNAYLPIIGGVEIAVHNIARRFQERQHSVEIVTARTYPHLPSKDIIQGISVTRIDFAPKSRFQRLAGFFKALWNSAGVVTRFQPDIVYIHFLAVHTLYFSILKMLMRFPYVLSARGNDVLIFPQESRIMNLTLRFSLRVADAVVFNSEFLCQAAMPLIYNIHAPIFIVGDGADLSEFENDDKAVIRHPFIFAMGRFVEKKGFDILIEAMSIINSSFPDLCLVLAGDGPERSKLEAMILAKGMTDRVLLTGFIGRDEIVRYLNGCELFVLPSRIEPVGIVNIEAMAARKAVVATRVGGVPDVIIDGHTGLLAEPTPESLAEKIIALLNDADSRARMGKAGRMRVEAHYTWEHIANQYLAIFEQVLKDYEHGKRNHNLPG